MPTITFQLADLRHLVKTPLTLEQLEPLIEKAKGEVEGYDAPSDTVTVSLDDTNLPYLWSVEGIARLLRGIMGHESGIPDLPLVAGSQEIIVDASVHSVRPHIVGFIAKGPGLTDHLLKQLVQLQEKFCDNYGRKRKNASIGLYSFKRITFPVHYKAVKPSSASFVPLGMESPLDLPAILREHPKGIEYGAVLAGHERYPLLIDDRERILSFPPIINSADLGRLEVGDTSFLFECTGLDKETVELGTAIFAQALHERGFSIETMLIRYPRAQEHTPRLALERVKLDHALIERLLGVSYQESQIKELLGKARLSYDAGIVTIPPFRRDILHQVDLIEDIAIMAGYETIAAQPMSTYTVGGTVPLQRFIDTCRELAVGLGHQEVFSAVLSNLSLLRERACLPDLGTIEIQNPMSESYAAVRTTLMPLLLELLSGNKHVEYPQRIFEQGIATRKHGGAAIDMELLTLASTHSSATFTEAKQAAESIARSFGLRATYAESELGIFVPGRGATLLINGVPVGVLGEAHPQVLMNFGLELPVALLEIDLSALHLIAQK